MPSPSKKRNSAPAKSRRVPPAKAAPKSSGATKKPLARPAAKPAPKPAPKGSGKPAPKPAAKPTAKPSGAKPAATEVVPEVPRRTDARRHLLSLSFLRDGDEFMARLETDAGQITELKNRSLDQLLTLVAGELEDLLE